MEHPSPTSFPLDSPRSSPGYDAGYGAAGTAGPSSATMVATELGSSLPTSNDFTDSQNIIRDALGVAAASISVIGCLLAFYWFVRMRRSFRHQ
jgi:homoserine acetyltransferase